MNGAGIPVNIQPCELISIICFKMMMLYLAELIFWNDILCYPVPHNTTSNSTAWLNLAQVVQVSSLWSTGNSYFHTELNTLLFPLSYIPNCEFCPLLVSVRSSPWRSCVLRLVSGRRRWKHVLPGGVRPRYRPPLQTNGPIIICSEDLLNILLDQTGTESNS